MAATASKLRPRQTGLPRRVGREDQPLTRPRGRAARGERVHASSPTGRGRLRSISARHVRLRPSARPSPRSSNAFRDRNAMGTRLRSLRSSRPKIHAAGYHGLPRTRAFMSKACPQCLGRVRPRPYGRRCRRPRATNRPEPIFLQRRPRNHLRPARLRKRSPGNHRFRGCARLAAQRAGRRMVEHCGLVPGTGGSEALAQSRCVRVASPAGIEPALYGLEDRCFIR